LVGFAQLDYNFYPKKNFRIITIGNKLKSFDQNFFEPKNIGINVSKQFYRFIKNETYLSFEFKKGKTTDETKHFVTLSSNSIWTEFNTSKYTNQGVFKVSHQTKYLLVNALNYQLKNSQVLYPYQVEINLQQIKSVLKLFMEYKQKLFVNKKNYVQFRIFAGSFLSGSENQKRLYSFKSGGFQGSGDYLYEYNYLGRNFSNGFASQQFIERDAALKVWTNLGNSTSWMSSINVKSPAWGAIPLRLFADVTYSDKFILSKQKVLWDAGVNFFLAQDVLEIYFPLAYSSSIAEGLKATNIYGIEKIRFTFNIHKLVPKNFIQNYFIH
jgi:hypothetical protein